MVRTSTAEKNNYRCPACGGALTRDIADRGYVAHVSNRDNCQFERGERDHSGSTPDTCNTTRPVLPNHEPTKGVRICGYSERGIFNALFYAIEFSSDPVSKLAELLSLVSFPGMSVDFSNMLGAEVLVEQSLSQFGDADAILLLHGAKWRRVVFIEGKVKSHSNSRTIRAFWREFLKRRNGRLDSSNLFTQLYHKVRFISALRDGGIEALQHGVAFPACSTRAVRKLGKNPVVLHAAEMIKAYAQEVLYVAFVPDSAAHASLEQFYTSELVAPSDVTGWSTEGWGFLTWELVEDYCRQRGFESTVRVFDFNRGQIY
ncbi:MAG: hypothetical protein ACOX5J_08615 [Candidatus Hydrogenedentales bacterium]|jgi:hypothetical protein